MTAQRAAARGVRSRVAALAMVLLAAVVAFPTPVAALSRWTGGLDLYRPGVYAMQQTWWWCTAADVQIMRNIVFRQADHTKASQQRYFDYMRAHDRYAIPVTDGVDPQGWAAGLRAFVDARYRLVATTTFDAALHSAVTRLRLTNRPVGLVVAYGDHAWVLTGFTATADPALTSHFQVTSVRVTGPLYGMQSRGGYDMPPDTKLSTSAFRTFLTPFHDRYVRTVWDGLYVTMQAIPGAASAAPRPTPRPTPRPAATAPPSPDPPFVPGPPALIVPALQRFRA